MTDQVVAPQGSIGFRWGEKGKWNLEQRAAETPVIACDVHDGKA